MICVEELTKRYGDTAALAGVSFEVEQGQVVGFLGPNGAGKSTTMRILTGFLRATSGRASLGGFDVAKDPLEVQRRVGYLPESTPLYQEMLVLDHLAFAAEIRGLRRAERRRAVGRVVELCGLGEVTHKAVMELSKGYRQRVGLAQAMVHEPDVLILDEPTSGLDPNQIVEVRRLIADLGQRHTVLLSTHYMQEIERSADRVLILSRGRLVADGSVPELVSQGRAEGVLLEVTDHGPAVQAALQEAFPGRAVTHRSQARGVEPGTAAPRASAVIQIAGDADPQTCLKVSQLAAQSKWGMLRMEPVRPGLEEVFRSLTGGGEVPVGQPGAPEAGGTPGAGRQSPDFPADETVGGVDG